MDYSCKLAERLEKKYRQKKKFAQICDRIYKLCKKRSRSLSEDNEKFWLWNMLEKRI